MKIRDILEFSKDSYFNGAVQTEWFYDNTRVEKISKSYVFHGPKYFGVSNDDISSETHKLIDTASFANIMAQKIYEDKSSNSFIMTIAGYGTGKSHLAVTLATLFSGHDITLRKDVTNNILSADNEIGKDIQQINTKKNIVIVLNGMNNFNLDYEILKRAQDALALHNYDDTVLSSVTKVYTTARHFVEQTYEMCKDNFLLYAHEMGVNINSDSLKAYLVDCIETEKKAFNIVNRVYKDINGEEIKWERGISAGDVLSILAKELCGKDKPFNKVIVLFDEFGRYIEYAAANPAIAGEAAMQQIFEAIQSADGKILFSGFIQSDLNAYLSRIEKTANIIRYVGRYEASDKLYLSSNFETILANLIKKNDENAFKNKVTNAIEKYEHFHSVMSSCIIRWNRNSINKSVWKNNDLYKKVILNGCYPLHPMTVWLLSNMSGWMQQRSTIAFAEEMFQSISSSEIDNTWLPYIYPINIIDSSIYDEMLNSEEKGLVQSQYCLLYREIMLKVGDKLQENEIKVLKAILVMNVGKFAFQGKDDALLAVRYCSGMKEEEILIAIKSLEDMHGVIAFDDLANKFDLIAEASGFNEFKRVYGKYRLMVRNFNGINEYDEDISNELQLSQTIETSFAQENAVSSIEWCFTKKLIDIVDFDLDYCKGLIRDCENATDGETPRGIAVYLYCTSDTYKFTQNIQRLYIDNKFNNYPIIIILVNDEEEEIVNAMKSRATLKLFPSTEQQRFLKYISGQNKAKLKMVVHGFNKALTAKLHINEDGVSEYNMRITQLCSSRFSEVYNKIPPFSFDGFEKKASTQAKKYLFDICLRMFDNTLMNIQSYQALASDEKNRIKSVLSLDSAISWKVFDSNCLLLPPQNELIFNIYNDVLSQLSSEKPMSGYQIFKKYLFPPYGMNEYSLTLFIAYFISMKGKELLSFYNGGKLRTSHISDDIIKIKQNKLQFNELLKIQIQINNHIEADAVGLLCEKILSNKFVEQCKIMQIELNNLLCQEDVSPEAQALVARAKSKLDDGERIRKKIYTDIVSADTIIEESKTNFVLYKFTRAFQLLPKKAGKIEDYSDYEYSPQYNENTQNLLDQANRILDANIIASLKNIKCNITQLSQIKALYKNSSLAMRENHKENYAEMIDSRIDELELDLKAKQKYESIIVECEKETALCSNAANYTFKQCNVLITKMQGWNSYVKEKQDMTNTIKNELLVKISGSFDKLLQRKEQIENIYKNLLIASTHISQYESVAEMMKISSVLKCTELDDNMMESVTTIESDLNRCIEFFTYKNISVSVLELMNCFLLKEKENCCYNLMQFQLEHIKSIIEIKKKEWVKLYIDNVINNIRIMSAQECLSWKTKTENPPAYLDECSIQKYTDTLDLMNNRLKECRVQGVVLMFKDLTDEEQQDCLSILSAEIKQWRRN